MSVLRYYGGEFRGNEWKNDSACSLEDHDGSEEALVYPPEPLSLECAIDGKECHSKEMANQNEWVWLQPVIVAITVMWSIHDIVLLIIRTLKEVPQGQRQLLLPV